MAARCIILCLSVLLDGAIGVAAARQPLAAAIVRPAASEASGLWIIPFADLVRCERFLPGLVSLIAAELKSASRSAGTLHPDVLAGGGEATVVTGRCELVAPSPGRFAR